MAFNFCQFFILFGLLLGVICIAVLLGSSSFNRKSNYLLSILIFSFIGNLGQYWLEDVGLIDSSTMQLIFIPWQMLVAPVFLLYVYSLKVFNHYPFRKWILFLPFVVALSIHLLIKALILREGASSWSRPEWVSTFYLIEELTSLLYCLIITIIVYRWIWLEKKRSNYMGFGVNKEIVMWIKTMMQMGLVLAVTWTVSLYLVNTRSNDLSSYYLLWCLMATVLNVLGFVGIFYSIRAGEFSEVNLTLANKTKISDSVAIKDFAVSAPRKYLGSDSVDSIISLTSKFAQSNSESSLNKHLENWFQNEFLHDIISFHFENHMSMMASIHKNTIVIPIVNEGSYHHSLVLDLNASKSLTEANLYYINMAVLAFGFHNRRIASYSKNQKIRSNNKVYRSLLDLLENEEVYTDPQMDLSLLSSKLDVSTGYLSKVINDAGNKSFNALINDYRIDKVKRIMQDKSYDHFTIVGYGLEAGFNSKSTFYKAFQKREGVSPGKYLEKATGVKS